jgi:hypothetical protein
MLDELTRLLSKRPAGPLEDTSTIEILLADDWHRLSGSDQAGMQGYKLKNRMKNATWAPPELAFEIERHGGTALGSVRAELHRWIINVNSGSAVMAPVGYRPVKPAAAPIVEDALTTTICRLIVDGKKSRPLQWFPDRRVRLKVGLVIPDGVKQTVSSRRKRFRKRLETVLATNGWFPVGQYTYKRADD